VRNVSVKNCRESQNTRAIFNDYFFIKPLRLWDNAEKYGRVRHAADENVIRSMRFGILDN